MRLDGIKTIGPHRFKVTLSDDDQRSNDYVFEVTEASGIRVVVPGEEFSQRFVPSKAPAAVYEAVLAVDTACSVELEER